MPLGHLTIYKRCNGRCSVHIISESSVGVAPGWCWSATAGPVSDAKSRLPLKKASLGHTSAVLLSPAAAAFYAAYTLPGGRQLTSSSGALGRRRMKVLSLLRQTRAWCSSSSAGRNIRHKSAVDGMVVSAGVGSEGFVRRQQPPNFPLIVRYM